MPLTDEQKEEISAHATALGILTDDLHRIVTAPTRMVWQYENIDPAETDHDVINLVNATNAKAIAKCDEIKLYLQGMNELV